MDQKATSVPSSRLVGLDILRIGAAFLVFLFHSHIHIGCQYGIFNRFVNMGAIFMTAFFLLSGFALFYSQSKKELSKVESIKPFYIKRFITIFPLYYITAILYVLLLGKETLKQNLLLAPIELLGLQSVFTSIFSFTHNGGTWFVSCLAICYLLYPYLQEFTKQISNKTRLLLAGICVAILLWSPLIQLYFNTGSIYANPFFRVLEFFIGVLLCAVFQSSRERKWLRILGTWPVAILAFALLVAGVSVASKAGIPEDYMLYGWVALPLFMVLLLSLAKLPFRSKNRPVTDYLCKISYAFFFAQFFVWRLTLTVLDRLGTHHNLIKIAVSFVICLVFTVLLHELVEKPAKKLLTKWLGRSVK